jgi:alkylation response protein AidB-like acyl-CoA dehydrogenase
MTFDLSPDQRAARDRARAFSREHVEALAAQIDRDGIIPVDLSRAASSLLEASLDLVGFVVTIEELAAASGSLALSAASAGAGATTAVTLSGLRGAVVAADAPQQHLVLAAIAVGLGTAAVETTLAELRAAASQPGHNTDRPHWLVADAATEMEAARLLTYQAAQEGNGAGAAAVAQARLFACAAAQRAVDAALRVCGAAGFQEGALLERLTRDTRAATLLFGAEEPLRATAAEGLLPE